MPGVEITGRGQGHARQELRRWVNQPPGRSAATVAVIDRRKAKPHRHSYDVLVVLQRIWAVPGGLTGFRQAVRATRDGL